MMQRQGRHKYVWGSWDEAEPHEDWELALEFTVTSEENARFCSAESDFNHWYLKTSPWGAAVVSPVLINQYSMRTQNALFWVPPPAGQSTFHARTEAEFHHPIRVGQRVHGWARFPQKYERRGSNWVVYETKFLADDGTLLAFDRRVRYCGRKGVGVQRPPSPTEVSPATMAGAVRGEDIPRLDVPALHEGLELPRVIKTLRVEDMQAFSESGQPSIHTSDETARERGLDRAAAQGLQSCGFLQEVIVRSFGKPWFTNGRIDVAYIYPTFSGDTVRTTAKVASLRKVDGGTEVGLALACHKQDGKQTVTGTATLIV